MGLRLSALAVVWIFGGVGVGEREKIREVPLKKRAG
jgi:hypothetical protein